MSSTLGVRVDATVPEDWSAPARTFDTLSLARPALARLLLASLLGALAIASTIALMATSAWMLSRASQHPDEAALGLSIVAVQFFALSRAFFRYGERLVGHDAAFRLLGRVRVRFFEHVETLAPAGLTQFAQGDLLARMVADVDGLQELLLRVIPPSVVAALVGALTVGGLWAILPAAGMVTLVTLGGAAIAVPWLTSMLDRRTKDDETALRGELAVAFTDLVEGASELAVFGAAAAHVELIASIDGALRRAASRRAWLSGLGLGLTTLLAGLAAAGNLCVGVVALHAGHLSGLLLGTITLVPLAAFELVAPLPVAAQSLSEARRSATRLDDVLSTAPPVVEPTVGRRLGTRPHHVEVRGATASYPTSRVDALRDVDLALSPGRLVAIVGQSGAGKSTLAALLVDFLSASAGELTLDDVPYSSYTSDDVRQVVGLLEQLPHLFDTTIEANLRLARPDASDEALADALEVVGLSTFVATLPLGAATDVGRRGARLSGGQRQRLGAARALLARWPVVVLDEPTEHLEPAAADALLDALLDADPERATVLITHRLAGLERADEVLVLDDGAIVERGSHAELAARDGRYAQWWRDERLREPGHGVGQARS